MNPSGLKWWQWLLVGAAFFAVFVIIGPEADRHGYGSPVTLLASIVAAAAWSASWVVGFMRFVKWLWSLKRPS
jgi:hypothetical protein